MFANRRLLISFVLLPLLVGCGKDNKGIEGDKSQPSPMTPKGIQSPTNAKGPNEPDYKLTMAALEQENQKDEAGTKKKYAGKVLELSGVVEFPIIGNAKETVTFSLQSPKPSSSSFSISCISDDRSLYGTLGRGQTLRVRGVYGEFGGYLKPCEVVEKGPDTLVRITAKQLASEFTANWDEAGKKYDQKTLVVTGTVSKIKPYGEGLKINCLELEGDGKTIVECRYNKPEVADQYKVGDTVKLVGSISLSARGVLNIVPCYPLPK